MVRSTLGKRPEYFEAILQLRDCAPQIVTFVHQELSREKIHIAKTIHTTNGVDLYIVDKNFTRALGKRLQQTFGGKCQMTASLFGNKDGKEVYRLTVLFRGLEFSRGQEVEYKGDKYKVLALGREMMLQSISNGNKIHLKYTEMGKVKKV